MNNNEPRETINAELWELAKKGGAVDRSQIGITAQKTKDGLQSLTESWNRFFSSED